MPETKCNAVVKPSAKEEKVIIKGQLLLIVVYFAIAYGIYVFLRIFHETPDLEYIGYAFIYGIYAFFIFVGAVILMVKLPEIISKTMGLPVKNAVFVENLIGQYYFLLVLIIIGNHIIYYISNNKNDYNNLGNPGTFGHAIKSKLYPLAHLLMYKK
jgi:hypothetical protein